MVVEYVPIRYRIWCRPSVAGPFLGRGRTWIFNKIRSGEIVSKLDGPRIRLVHVPSLIARFGLPLDQLESGETEHPAPELAVGSNSQAVPAAQKDKASRQKKGAPTWSTGKGDKSSKAGRRTSAVPRNPPQEDG
jgi:hypothetical protein